MLWYNEEPLNDYFVWKTQSSHVLEIWYYYLSIGIAFDLMLVKIFLLIIQHPFSVRSDGK